MWAELHELVESKLQDISEDLGGCSPPVAEHPRQLVSLQQAKAACRDMGFWFNPRESPVAILGLATQVKRCHSQESIARRAELADWLLAGVVVRDDYEQIDLDKTRQLIQRAKWRAIEELPRRTTMHRHFFHLCGSELRGRECSDPWLRAYLAEGSDIAQLHRSNGAVQPTVALTQLEATQTAGGEGPLPPPSTSYGWMDSGGGRGAQSYYLVVERPSGEAS